jgi:acyl-CoA synthetase (AMP-forming)/AMP-acid ligase II
MWRSMEPTCLPMTLAARLAAQADRLGGRCFFHYGGVDHSYAAAAPDGILAFLQGQLAAYKLPTSVEVIAAIPKTGSGKIRRVELRDRAAAKEE